jgi:hypothetical protein
MDKKFKTRQSSTKIRQEDKDEKRARRQGGHKQVE